MTDDLLRTQLYDWHKEHGDVVPFSGWEMPVRYTDIREEHMAVRDGVGIFDTSHMSRFFIKGSGATEFLQTMTTNNVNKLAIHGGHYTTCLNEEGGIRDDLLLYRISESEFIWVTNAVNGPKIWKHLNQHAEGYHVTLVDRTSEVSMIAVQGPSALQLLSNMAGCDTTEFPRFSCNPVTLSGYSVYLCRTGYTGEAGAELLVLDTPMTDEGKKRAISFWEELLTQGKEYGILPCGLGSRDSLRLEAGLVLYGHELNEETSPIEASIPYAVKFKVEPHYLGYDVARSHKKEKTFRKTRIGLEMIDRGIPRQGYPIMFNGENIGEVTSGGLALTKQTAIGLAYVQPRAVTEGDTVEIDLKGRSRKAKVVGWPFFDPERYGERRTV
jgi:aminomethyltransferase